MVRRSGRPVRTSFLLVCWCAPRFGAGAARGISTATQPSTGSRRSPQYWPDARRTRCRADRTRSGARRRVGRGRPARAARRAGRHRQDRAGRRARRSRGESWDGGRPGLCDRRPGCAAAVAVAAGAARLAGDRGAARRGSRRTRRGRAVPPVRRRGRPPHRARRRRRPGARARGHALGRRAVRAVVAPPGCRARRSTTVRRRHLSRRGARPARGPVARVDPGRRRPVDRTGRADRGRCRGVATRSCRTRRRAPCGNAPRATRCSSG